MSEPVKRHHRYSYDQYLSHEDGSNVKHEFLDGEIYAMAGGSRAHAALSVAISSALLTQLRARGCSVFSSDLKVRVLETGLVTYPDVTVVCGPAQEDPQSRHVLVNPTIVVEVTSPSSEEWDRGEKLEHYRKIASLQACVLVSHTERRLEVILRQGAGWTTKEAGAGDTVTLAGLGVALVVDDLYQGIDLAV